ncbi:MAG: hemerythrin domain-containing protein [Planctomycetota bacterium]
MSADKVDLNQHRKFHSQLSEEIGVFKLAMPYVYTSEAFNNVRNVMSFFIDTIAPHFEGEERNLFPVALVLGNMQIKQAVRELQHEHITMLGKMDVLKEVILKLGFSINDEQVKDEFVRLSKDIIELIILHARKEDEELFPYLENIDEDLLKQVAELKDKSNRANTNR